MTDDAQFTLMTYDSNGKLCSGVMNYDPAVVREGALEIAYIIMQGERAPTDNLRRQGEAENTGDTRQGRVLRAQPERAIATVSVTFLMISVSYRCELAF